MRNQFAILLLFVLLALPRAAWAENQPAMDAAAGDEQVIAVLEILELMEMVDDITLFKDMEYLMEESPNEPQK